MKRPTPATAISIVALFFSLGGVSLAASKYLITNTHQIKPNVLRYLHGQRGPAGSAGSAGAPGAPGAAGAAGATGAAGVFSAANLSVVDGPITPVAPSTTGSSIAVCPAGDTVVSGGWAGPLVTTDIGFNEPVGTTEWAVIVSNDSVISENITAIAVCAS